MVKLNWVMTSYNNHEAKHRDYIITVKHTSSYMYWSIIKHGEIIDMCTYHTPTKDTASAKVQAEKCFNKIIMVK
jgi:hypothetical protein